MPAANLLRFESRVVRERDIDRLSTVDQLFDGR